MSRVSRLKASEGQWYADRLTHEIFCVIRVDDVDGLIDVRDGYGDIDEFDLDEWEHMDLEICTAPSGWVRDDDEDGESDDQPHFAPRVAPKG